MESKDWVKLSVLVNLVSTLTGVKMQEGSVYKRLALWIFYAHIWDIPSAAEVSKGGRVGVVFGLRHKQDKIECLAQ